MDQFSHDLTVALEETSLLDRVSVSSRWTRRRTCSTGNLPCAPQPTEDSSSSPTDTFQNSQANSNVDGLDTHNVPLHSDSEDELPCLPRKTLNAATRHLGSLESDSLNETFSPARFFKPNARRKRKLKRISMEYESVSGVSETFNVGDGVQKTTTSVTIPLRSQLESSFEDGTKTVAYTGTNTGTLRKRLIKHETNSRSNLFFFGKRKRSNRDRYTDHDDTKSHSTSMPRYTYMEEYCMRPRSFSATTKILSERLLPLNKGLVSKIEKISQQQRNNTNDENLTQMIADEDYEDIASTSGKGSPLLISSIDEKLKQLKQSPKQTTTNVSGIESVIKETSSFHNHRKNKRNNASSRRRHQLRQQLQFAVEQLPMDCGDLNDFLSSSSLSSSESDDARTTNGTDREGDDELTDWPGNEGGGGLFEIKFDPKRKLTKKSALPQIKSEDSGLNAIEDDTMMSTTPNDILETRYQPSRPIAINSRNVGVLSTASTLKDEMIIPLHQIESEMSGETSNPFLSSPPCQPTEVREIRAGCRRVKSERPGFSIKTSVNERLARFLQDARQIQIRLPDIEIYEHDSLINLATLYSLKMNLENGCAVLTKTSNTTQSVNVDQPGIQSRLFLSDFKRRCYDKKGSLLPRK